MWFNSAQADSGTNRICMGATYIDGTVTGPSGNQATVRLLIDSGAKYTLLPEKDWRAIGLKRKRTLDFVLTDGTTIQRGISECHVALPQGDATTPVILGEK